MKLVGPFRPPRKAALGKTIYVRELRGRLIVCKWPRRRQRITNPTTLEQMEKFRQANWLTKYVPAPIQIAHRQMVEGTQLLPRDLMIAAMYGRGFTWQLQGYRRRYPVAALRDLSDTLDIFGTIPGDVLGRGADRWYAITPAQAGLVLVSQAPGLPPAWQGVAPGQGIWQKIEDVTLAIGLGLNVYRDVIIPATAKQLKFNVWVPNTASGTQLSARLNGDTGANYFYGATGVQGGPSSLIYAGASQPQFHLTPSQLQAAGFRTYLWGSVFQADPAERVGIESRANAGGTRTVNLTGQWVPPSSQQINKLSFASIAGSGLPAGTRIVVTAAIY